MTVSEENTGKDVFLYELLGQFRLRNIVKKIDWVDLSDLNDPRFSYDGRYTVILSSTTDLSRRLSLIESAIGQLAEGDAGTLELEMAGESSKVFFSPN